MEYFHWLENYYIKNIIIMFLTPLSNWDILENTKN